MATTPDNDNTTQLYINHNTFYHINQIQLFWISNITTYSFTIRLKLQEFHLGLTFTELDDITILKNFGTLHIDLFQNYTTHCHNCIMNFIISNDYTTRTIANTIDIIFSTNTFLLQSMTPTPPPRLRSSESTNTNHQSQILCNYDSNHTKHFKYI